MIITKYLSWLLEATLSHKSKSLIHLYWVFTCYSFLDDCKKFHGSSSWCSHHGPIPKRVSLLLRSWTIRNGLPRASMIWMLACTDAWRLFINYVLQPLRKKNHSTAVFFVIFSGGGWWSRYKYIISAFLFSSILKCKLLSKPKFFIHSNVWW